MVKGKYRFIHILGKRYPAHRIAWLLANHQWPVADIDHIDGVKDDNRIANLRDVSRRTNAENQRVGRRLGGLLGATYFKRLDCWVAHIRVNYVKQTIGYFPTELAAHEAYIARKRIVHQGCTL